MKLPVFTDLQFLANTHSIKTMVCTQLFLFWNGFTDQDKKQKISKRTTTWFLNGYLKLYQINYTLPNSSFIRYFDQPTHPF